MKTLQDFFKLSIFASGTPANFQKVTARTYPEYSVQCSFKDAVKENYILKPFLNLVCTSYRENFPAAIKAVFEREVLVADVLNSNDIAPRIIVNCQGIDEIENLLNNEYFKLNIGKLFHLIAIHTRKDVVAADGITKQIHPSIDGVIKEKKVLMTEIQEKIDKNIMFNDNLPIILFQVDTISEGINLRSFSSTIITTDNPRRAMQQIGRVVRHYSYGNGQNKRIANVYLLNENFEKIETLIYNLNQTDLLDKCFDWGGSIIPVTGSGNKPNDEPGMMLNFNWDNLKDNSPEIVAIREHNEKLTKQELVLDQKQFQAEIDKTEKLFDTLFNECKFTPEQESYFFEKYILNDKFKFDRNLCMQFYKEVSDLNLTF